MPVNMKKLLQWGMEMPLDLSQITPSSLNQVRKIADWARDNGEEYA